MSKECIDIGKIQEFLDGETPPEVAVKMAGHFSDCDSCALLLSQAEDENALVFSALENELNSLVPTQRLWSRINESIDHEKENASIWKRAYGLLAFYLANPSLSAAAGVLVIFALAAGVWTLRPLGLDSGSEIAAVPIAENAAVPASSDVGSANGPDISVATLSEPDMVRNELPPVVDREVRRPAVITANYSSGSVRQAQPQPEARPMTLQYIAGEESYVRTIAQLSSSVDGQKDRVLPPASRVAFERDLAVVDDSIKRMREYVRKNPRNQTARQVLYASYQDKIDLLNSVGQREELMASLR